MTQAFQNNLSVRIRSYETLHPQYRKKLKRRLGEKAKAWGPLHLHFGQVFSFFFSVATNFKQEAGRKHPLQTWFW